MATNGSDTPIDIVRKVQLAPRDANLGVKKDDPVAMFVFSQFGDDTIHLTVQNILSNQNVTWISFAFEVEFQPQVVSRDTQAWRNQGAVTNLKSSQIADAGIIAVSAIPVSMGEIQISILGEGRIDYK